MKANAIHPTIRQALGCHEGFRKLGFLPEDIFVVLNPNKAMLVVLKTQDKQFAVTVGKVNLPESEWLRQWTAAATAVVDGSVSQADMDAIWQDSLPFKQQLAFVAGILQKGIRVPKMGAKLN